jgi:hypothetical protein
MIEFHTPKLPKPLNLDLVQLGGGGSCPSQFYGKTHEGHDVYVRYRGGLLSVRIGRDPGNDAAQGSPILEVDIGPKFDGNISLTQFCRYFGVTIAGTVPEEKDVDAHLYSDLSGDTTFCRTNVERVTLQTSREILKVCMSIFPSAILVKPVLGERYKLKELIKVPLENVDDDVWLIDGVSNVAEVRTSPTQYILPTEGQLQIFLKYDLWKRPEPLYTNGFREVASKELGRDLIEAGMRETPKDHALAYSTFKIDTEFSSTNDRTRKLLSLLGEVIKELLPVTPLDHVDLKTGRVVSKLNEPLDPVMKEWCRSGSDRWLSILRDGNESLWIGVRPSKVL